MEKHMLNLKRTNKNESIYLNLILFKKTHFSRKNFREKTCKQQFTTTRLTIQKNLKATKHLTPKNNKPFCLLELSRLLLSVLVIFFSGSVLSQDEPELLLSGSVSYNNGDSSMIYLWSQNSIVGFHYEEKACGGRLFPIYELDAPALEKDFVQMLETVDYGFEHCGLGSRVVISKTNETTWSFDRHQSYSPFPEFSGELTPNNYTANTDIPSVIPPPQGAVIVDPLSGLSLGIGDRIRGVGPTSIVIEVEQGSPAERSGISEGELILSVMDGAGFPATHVETIRAEYGKNTPVEFLIQSVEGDRRNAVLILPTKINDNNQTERQLTLNNFLSSEAIDLLSTSQLDSEKSYIEQISQLAEALGIAERDVSVAISDGRMNPTLNDLESAFLEFPGMSCEDIYQKNVSTLIAAGREQFAEQQLSMFRRDPDTWCQYLAFLIDDVRVSAWNDRFGPLPTRLVTRRIDPTVVAYYNANDVRKREYAQIRCDFTAAMQQIFPDKSIFVDCGSLKPTITENLALAQMAAAQREDIFGPAENLVSWRIRLFADGAYEALEKLAIIDMEQARSHFVSHLGQFIHNGPAPTYTPLISSYASARLDFLGSCGDSLTTLMLSVKNEQTTSTVSGIQISRNDFSYVHEFEALTEFEAVIRSVNWVPPPGAPGWREVADRFSVIFNQLECDSQERKTLESSMLEYINRLSRL
tara:strand:+ start:1390 stop:3483 length:2094 start_codon:yes stop_codon:yes gene_type:complete